MYLIILTLGFCFSYFILAWLFSRFFRNTNPVISLDGLRSILMITAFNLIIFIVSLYIRDPEISNRVIHAFGGGFSVVLLCFLVIKDIKLPINKFQFFVFSALLATALGVANELLEFFLQNYSYFEFAKSINDTWLDLLSNTIGILIGILTFAPLVKESRRSQS